MLNAFEEFEKTCREDFVMRTTTGVTTIYDIQFEQDPYSRVDCTFQSGFTEYVSELKIRSYEHSKTWNNQPGFVFEYIKWSALKDHKVHNKLFIIIFNDCVCIWNIGEMNLKWKDEWLSSTHNRSSKKLKKVCYLELKDCSHIYKT
jgi:hypothetical protein